MNVLILQIIGQWNAASAKSYMDGLEFPYLISYADLYAQIYFSKKVKAVASSKVPN